MNAAELVLLVLAVVVLWLAHSAFRPNARCWWCRGKPRNESSTGRTWRNCVVCRGKGSRERVGYRLLARFRRTT